VSPHVALLLIAAAWASPTWAADGIPPTAARVDRIVVVVGDRIVTDGDLYVEVILATHDVSPLAVVEWRRQQPEEWLVDLAVIRLLAGDIAVYRPSAAAVDQRVKALQASVDSPRAWSEFLLQLGLDEEGLATLLSRRMVAERYIQRNVLARARKEEDDASIAEIYLTWVTDQRATLSIRRVPPIDARELP
jgi:hypothetical protein